MIMKQFFAFIFVYLNLPIHFELTDGLLALVPAALSSYKTGDQ